MAFGRKYSSPPTLRAKNQRTKPGSWISQNGPASIGLGWRVRQNTATKSAGFKPNAPARLGWCGVWREPQAPEPRGVGAGFGLSDPLRTLEDYDLFLYTLPERSKRLRHSTVPLVRRGAS